MNFLFIGFSVTGKSFIANQIFPLLIRNGKKNNIFYVGELTSLYKAKKSIFFNIYAYPKQRLDFLDVIGYESNVNNSNNIIDIEGRDIKYIEKIINSMENEIDYIPVFTVTPSPASKIYLKYLIDRLKDKKKIIVFNQTDYDENIEKKYSFLNIDLNSFDKKIIVPFLKEAQIIDFQNGFIADEYHKYLSNKIEEEMNKLKKSAYMSILEKGKIDEEQLNQLKEIKKEEKIYQYCNDIINNNSTIFDIKEECVTV